MAIKSRSVSSDKHGRLQFETIPKVCANQMAASELMTTANGNAPNARAAGTAVWDRLWTYEPSDEKDAALLAREYNGPRWQLVRHALEHIFGTLDGLRTVELGAGRGDLSALLAREGAEVTLFDQSDTALASAQRRFDRLGLAGRFEKGDLLGGLAPWRTQFDVAISLGVIEHFKAYDRTRVLQAHRDVLVSGGVAVVSVPNRLCPPYRLWKAYLELRGWWPYGMERPYSRRELRRRARAAGLADVRVYGLGLWQSVADHWIKRVRGKGPDWSNKPSLLDPWLGSVLLMFGRSDAARSQRRIDGEGAV